MDLRTQIRRSAAKSTIFIKSVDQYSINKTDQELNILSRHLKNIYETNTPSRAQKAKLAKKYIFNYPVVYIIYSKRQNGNYVAYIGETINIKQRTDEHLGQDVDNKSKWQYFMRTINKDKNSKMYIIGNRFFNKSMTMDIENVLIHFLSSNNYVNTINGRGNPQYLYSDSFLVRILFDKIWRALRKYHKHNSDVNNDDHLFPLSSLIKNEAIFQISPFTQLSQEQIIAKNQLISNIEAGLNGDTRYKLNLIEGDPGSGKSVILSELMYHFNTKFLQFSEEDKKHHTPCYLVERQSEQRNVYDRIMTTLGLNRALRKYCPYKKINLVGSSNTFLNDFPKGRQVDILLVDEGHLLFSQPAMEYPTQKDNPHQYQLEDMLKRAKVVVAVYDKSQVFRRDQYKSLRYIKRLLREYPNSDQDNIIHLHYQYRIKCHNPKTLQWIQNFNSRKNDSIGIIPPDKSYDLKVAETPWALEGKIMAKSHTIRQSFKKNHELHNSSLCRMIATYDWKYNNPEEKEVTVKSQNWGMYWDYTNGKKSQSWLENPVTLDEVGSVYTVQGFDLNYAGLIIGKSVGYDKEHNSITINRHVCHDTQVERKRHNSGPIDKEIKSLLRNQLGILMTRGVRGLYIYACDPELEKALLLMAKPNHKIIHENKGQLKNLYWIGLKPTVIKMLFMLFKDNLIDTHFN